ncbi:GntR family transcriptional regulator [Roseisalinus antarcticus]|uniref:GntR family transcriptional regulator n=1 Tax=Roseisalinus antarcticus TaxID=254357 RepID=UPI0013562930|nr:GntR family transcriptional regulator [Roseisalinus antarcticus]
MDQASPLIDRRTWTRRDGPLWQIAYDTLLRMIQRRELPAHVPVVENQLAQQLGISRTPLRQALLRLEIEGRLQKTVNHSYVVRRVELKEYLQSLRVRQFLEPEAAALSAGRIPADHLAAAHANLLAVKETEPYSMPLHWKSDDEVHDLFIENCGNDTMADILRSLRVTTNLFEIERLSERLIPDSQQHERILETLEQADAGAAREAVADHIQSLFEFAVRTVA